MNKKEFNCSPGFTLAEIVVSLLLLSIITLGSFKTFHLVQSSSNSSLADFQQLQLQQQLFILSRLKQTYSTISSSDEFESLHCLIEYESKCP